MTDAGTSSILPAPTELRSEAFRVAVLRSERIRIFALLLILLFLQALICVRTSLVGGDQAWGAVLRGTVIIGFAVAYELVMLAHRAGPEYRPSHSARAVATIPAQEDDVTAVILKRL